MVARKSTLEKNGVAKDFQGLDIHHSQKRLSQVGLEVKVDGTIQRQLMFFFKPCTVAAAGFLSINSLIFVWRIAIIILEVGWSPNYDWLVHEPTQLKNIRQNGNLPQVSVKIKKYLKPPPSTVYW